MRSWSLEPVAARFLVTEKGQGVLLRLVQALVPPARYPVGGGLPGLVWKVM